MPGSVERFSKIQLERPSQMKLPTHNIGRMIGANNRAPHTIKDIAAKSFNTPMPGKPPKRLVAQRQHDLRPVLAQDLFKIRGTVFNGLVLIGRFSELIIGWSALKNVRHQEVLSPEGDSGVRVFGSSDEPVKNTAGPTRERATRNDLVLPEGLPHEEYTVFNRAVFLNKATP